MNSAVRVLYGNTLTLAVVGTVYTVTICISKTISEFGFQPVSLSDLGVSSLVLIGADFCVLSAVCYIDYAYANSTDVFTAYSDRYTW